MNLADIAPTPTAQLRLLDLVPVAERALSVAGKLPAGAFIVSDGAYVARCEAPTEGAAKLCAEALAVWFRKHCAPRRVGRMRIGKRFVWSADGSSNFVAGVSLT